MPNKPTAGYFRLAPEKPELRRSIRKMKYKKPELATEADFTCFMGKVFVMLYLFSVLGLVVTWRIEGGPLWPTAVTAIIAIPLMLLGFLLGRLPALRMFREQRRKAESKLRGLEIEHPPRTYF